MYQFDRIAERLPTRPPRDPQAEAPLKSIRVVDFTHFVAGPYATMLLADLGADVIKLEAPGKGEDFRHYPPSDPKLPLQGAPYLWTNRNKRSVAIDLKSADGRRIARELVDKADVVVENFSTGVMARFGLDFEQCRERNPRLIYCSVSAYGRTGRFADRLGFDPVVQAESGFMSMNGYPDRDGVKTAATVMDISTAMMAANAIMAALLARERTGRGQFIETTLFDAAVTMTGFAAMQHLCAGKVPVRTANSSGDTCPSGLFRTQDKSFYLNCANNGTFKRLFTRVLEMPEIADDPALATAPLRLMQRDRLFAILNERFASHPWAYWQPKLLAAGVPSGVVRSLEEALASDEVLERKIVTRIPHAEVGWIPNVELPIRFSDTPPVEPVAAPRLGQHTRQVLTEVLGYSEEEIARVVGVGAVGLDREAPRADHRGA
ncbi:CaiB/BaiF CoA transferase family protein [Cupriavidus sp. CuC1]|uniref:CaiB/BaiF CoA transferase family protein n=1 Tax=Cupriavidus sp. CuC1 TaxID=3373131 RepID=UPI0037D38C8C